MAIIEDRPALAGRMSRIKESPSSRVADRVREFQAAGREVLPLTIGEPDFDTPEHVKEAAIAAIRAGETKYTSANGTPALRAAIRERLLRKTGLACGPDEICVGGGAKQLIFLAFLATLDEGDEVIVPTPHWVSYPDMVTVNGGHPVLVETGAETGYKLTAGALRAAITDRTKWLVLNTPCNPTGAVYDEAELESLVEVLRTHPHVSVLCDEIYDEINFGARPVPSAITVAPELRERIFLVNGVSKAYAMTGWRIGYGAGSATLCAAISTLQSQSSSCPSSVSQAAAAAALHGGSEFIEETVAVYRERRDLLVSGLSAIDGLRPIVPAGGFYVWTDVSALLGSTTPDGRRIDTDSELAEHFLETAGVVVIPGDSYGAPGHFRASFALNSEVLRKAVSGLAHAVSRISRA
ncbi:aminotransferase class I/II-fold pyridoxal phosphate-dependent enzyme [Saccharopolyspora sp. 6M]|uniref:aminotransferase class I/II-fold pyridoxal phosphate-dependent enzyme n=1 Tax=Saccharopolyspora sp. 6M TaxID=2877237 RepID=UPI001CD5C815|nr:aminotransferase class I/II-fold pyridoxal phosphate-dependent enzyme [Saccharopolyspora sp. 6M]MCA1228847.1 aminotransferase class I/II-fold pyridoxal phosphate-dependent enzyme [Saccharopolyspora sp. 6M]